MYVDLMKEVLNFAPSFEKKYREKLDANRISDFVKVVMVSNFLTKTSSQSYYQCIHVAKMILNH